MSYSYIGGPLPEVDEEGKEEEGKLGTKTLDQLGEWFSNTAYGKRFKEGQERNAALEQTIIDQGGIGSLYYNLKNKPNELEQNLLKGISDVTNIDERITTPATYFALSGGLRSLSKLKLKNLGISQSISKIKTLPEPTVARSLINVTEGQSIFNMPTKVKGVTKPKGLLRKYQNPKGGEVYDPNVFISKAEMSAMLNTMTVDGAEGYGLFSVSGDVSKNLGLELSGLSGAAKKTAKQIFFTEIYDPKWAAARKLDPSLKIPDDFAYTGAFHPTGVMTKFKPKKGGKFKGFEMSPHHFTLDDDLAYSSISTTKNPSEVVGILNDTYEIFPGNHPRNFIMSYHDNTALRSKQQIKQITNLWEEQGLTPPPLGDITKFLKAPSEGKMIGKGATLLEEIDMMAAVRKKGMDKKNWSEILPKGKTIKDLEFDPVVLGIDHQGLIHGIGDNLPSRLKLLKLVKTDKWTKMTSERQALEIAKVSRQQQNVSLRINQIRLKLIKERMTELGLPTNDWTDIQVWMIQNPSEAASLNWHGLLSKGPEIRPEDLIKDLPREEALEIKQVFNLEHLPKTGAVLDAKQSEVKSIQRDVKRDL